MSTHEPRRQRPLWKRSPLALVLVITGIGFNLTAPAAGQTQTTSNVVPVSEETSLLAEGWAMLSAGDAAGASARARVVLDKYPQSVAGLALAVEADITRGRAASGLNTYESWLGTRKLENPYLVRRIAMAYLREASHGSEPRSRIAALKALAAEGDFEALSTLAEATRKAQFAETKVMASLGDDNAVKAILTRLDAALGSNKLLYIDALAATHNPLAVPPIAKLLDDKEDWVIIAAAADALGKMGATGTTARLRPLLQEGRPGPVRWAAATALARMGDAGGATFLREQLVSEHSMLQIQAAEGLSFFGPNSDWMDTARRLTVAADPQVRSLAAKVIAPYDQPLAQSTLEALLSDPNPGIREGAAETLAGKVAADFATLRRLLRSSDAYSSVLAGGRITELTR